MNGSQGFHSKKHQFQNIREFKIIYPKNIPSRSKTNIKRIIIFIFQLDIKAKIFSSIYFTLIILNIEIFVVDVYDKLANNNMMKRFSFM